MSFGQVDLLRAGCCIAALDGEICELEMPILEKLRNHVGVGQASFNAMLERARSDPDFYEQQFKILQADPEPAIKTLMLVAAADHAIKLNERIVLQHFAEKLGMTPQRFDEIYAAAQKQIQQQAGDKADTGEQAEQGEQGKPG